MELDFFVHDLFLLLRLKLQDPMLPLHVSVLGKLVSSLRSELLVLLDKVLIFFDPVRSLIALVLACKLIESCKFSHMVILGHEDIQLSQNATLAAIAALNRLEHVGDGLASAVLVKLVVCVLQLGHGYLSLDVDSAMGVCFVCPDCEVYLLFRDDLTFHIKRGLAIGN